MEQLNEFESLMKNYSVTLDQLIIYENKKLDAIAANDVEGLDAYLKEEQAFLLKLRGLDIKREKLLEQLNMKGASFLDIISLTAGEERTQLETVFSTLTHKTKEIQSATDSTKKYIELHLHSLDILINQLGGGQQSSIPYNKERDKGNHTLNKGHFSSKKI